MVTLFLAELARCFIYGPGGTALDFYSFRCVWVLWLWSVYFGITVVWPESRAGVDISAKEMVPVMLAAAVWGRSWEGRRVRFFSDNAAVVAVIGRRSARHPSLLHLLRCLYFYAAHYQFTPARGVDYSGGCIIPGQ